MSDVMSDVMSDPGRERGAGFGGIRLGMRVRPRALLGGLAAGMMLGAPGRAGAQGQGLQVTEADGRLGAVEAFRAGDPGLGTGAGVGGARSPVGWRGLQEGPGASLNPFYFPMEYVDAERAQGRQVVGLLMNTPDWAAADPGRGGTSVPKNLSLPHDHPENYWGQFVRRVVELYKG